MTDSPPPDATHDFSEEEQSVQVDGADLANLPERIGRYFIQGIIGRGGFGIVYLARDEQLDRRVAIKVPRIELVTRAQDAQMYITEAQTVANLDHPNIVPVHDVGGTEEFPFFLVSKYIEGLDLASQLKQTRLSCYEAVDLVITVADALHAAHKQGLVHRDIKPGNILIDKQGRPFIVDFGLALREEDIGKGPRYVGTPSYMSPEQARGEGHRVDGRSDIFSLGVVLYELLVGKRPFRGDTQAERLRQVTSYEPRPLRQYDDKIPKELERVCLKAIAKRAADRYSTAKDFADELRHCLQQQSPEASVALAPPPSAPGAPPSTPGTSGTSSTHKSSQQFSEGQLIHIVPKGLRSFDLHDAEFFLELLPGPRDRHGLPDSLRFWKTRIEETDPDQTFPVGLIYGPSGCGKSSLVKAGLLPRLSDDMVAVYIEATPDETESRLLHALRKRCPALDVDLSLTQTLAALRSGHGIRHHEKLLIILDQFEQWLHAKRAQPEAELIQALRQCDGGRVQCIVMVRDDFWLAVSRFLHALEVRLVEGENSRLVDLFDLDHARKVLTAFGRAFGRLPDTFKETAREQKDFLKQSVAGLAEEGKIVCVRLALFAEMMKGKPWVPATLRQVGGTTGIGVTFLEETFSTSTAPPEHRLHQHAARAVLRSLLPESGADIKGEMKSHNELLSVSGYASRPQEFEELLNILDSEIRLITPTDPQGVAAIGDSSAPPDATAKYFQLTHDYLVGSLRNWLMRKRKESMRGRAELRLEDRCATWTARPENRHLPAAWEFANIRLLTDRRHWSAAQTAMMNKAARHHGARIALWLGVLLLVGLGLREGISVIRANALVDRLLEAETSDAPGLVAQMDSGRRWLDPKLHQAKIDAETAGDARKRLHVGLALLPMHAEEKYYLLNRLLEHRTSPDELLVIVAALQDHRAEFLEALWKTVSNPDQSPDRRLRAASALAQFDPDSGHWPEHATDVAMMLAEQSLLDLKWADALWPVREHLLSGLAFQLEHGQSVNHAVSLFRHFARDESRAAKQLESRLIATDSARSTTSDERIEMSRRRANLGATLVAIGQGEPVWPLLQSDADIQVRSWLIERFYDYQVDPEILHQRLQGHTEPSVRAALLLSLGQFVSDRRPPPQQRQRWIDTAEQLYRSHPHAEVHSAAEWLLRRLMPGRLLADVRASLETGMVEGRHWFVNGHGQTFVLVRAPGEVILRHNQHRVPMETGDYWCSTTEVTVAQYVAFRPDHFEIRRESAMANDCAINNVKFVEAAAYCNWLSEQEGIPADQWCYLPNENGEYDSGMKLAADYRQRRGYRMPTEAEWELAAHGNQPSRWHFGDDPELLQHYVWGRSNTNATYEIEKVGLLKPSHMGIFDAFGNVREMCQSGYVPDASIFEITADSHLISKGGSNFYTPDESNFSNRSRLETLSWSRGTGFRLVRIAK